MLRLIIGTSALVGVGISCERCHIDSVMFAMAVRARANQITPLLVQLGRFPLCIKEWRMYAWCLQWPSSSGAIWIRTSTRLLRTLICSARTSYLLSARAAARFVGLFCYLGTEAKPSVIKFPERKRNEICSRQHQDEEKRADLVPNCKALACLIYEGWNRRLVWGIALRESKLFAAAQIQEC
jgi:hypothetical protein